VFDFAGDELTLNGVDLGELTADDFVLA